MCILRLECSSGRDASLGISKWPCVHVSVCDLASCGSFLTSIISMWEANWSHLQDASLVTFQRVLQPHSWILLSQIVSGEQKGGQTETEEVRAENRRVKKSELLSILLNLPQNTLTPSSTSATHTKLLHADPALMLNYVRNFTHMLTPDKQQIFYCLNLAKPSVGSLLDFHV